MKKIIPIILLSALCLSVTAQAPQAFKYQAVARDASGYVLANKNVSFRISIIQGTVTGAIVYSELHAMTTNSFGLCNLEIGKGTSPSGSFSAINWGADTYFINVEMDPAGGTTYQFMGASQLLSVPYALRATTVEQEIDGDITNEIQTLSITGTNLTLSKEGGSVTLPSVAGGPFSSAGGVTNNTPLTDHFVFGSSKLDDVSGTADDSRLFFNKDKGAFRAGIANDNQWNDAYVGNSSVALGNISIARGFASFAMGDGTTSTGWASTAFGGGSMADGNYSFAAGKYAVASSFASVALGSFNVGQGTAGSWVDTDPILEVGIGQSGTSKMNALTILKNGNVGIGTRYPDYKLEVTGQLKISGGSPGTGKILTSDASGLASWQTPPASDNWGTQTVLHDFTLSGAGTDASPLIVADNGIISAKIADNSIQTADLADNAVTTAKISAGSVNGAKIAQSGATTGQVLGWNGTTWEPQSVASGSNPWLTSGSDIYFNTGKVGIGKIPGTSLRNFQSVTADMQAVAGVNNSALYAAVFGENLGTGPAADFRNYIRIIDGTQGSGKVLTSDVNGFTSWQMPMTITDATLAGTGTAASPLKIAQQSATTGSVLKWNGSIWTPAVDNTGSGLTLPYTGAISSSSPAFQVTNNGLGEGLKSTATSTGKTGIIGEAPNQAIFGHATATSGAAYGVQGASDSSTGSGMTGIGSSTTGQNFGVRGVSSSTEGKGVYGYTSSSTGATYGVYGVSSSSTGTGVYGEGKTAFHGITNATNGYGIFVECTDASSSPRGVYSSVASGFSGYFAGGDFYVGGDTGIGVVTPSTKLDVNGNARIRSIGSGAYYGPVNRMSDGTLTTSTSDARLKENIHSLNRCLDKVMQLRGVSFTWKTDPGMGKRIGFIAQEFEKVFPELVFANPVDGFMGINYAETTAVLAEAIKELNNKISALQVENDRLKAEISLMKTGQESRLSKLERLLEATIGTSAGKQ